GSQAVFRLVSVSDWLRKGTLRMTVEEAATAPALSWAENAPSGATKLARSRVSSAGIGAREPIAIGTPTRASLMASPKPRAPEAPMTATGSGGDGDTRAEYRLQLDEARGENRLRDGRRVGDRPRHGPPAGGGGRPRGDRRPQRGRRAG